MNQYRLWGGLGLMGIVLLGLWSKVYNGWGQAWINDFSGDILYEMAWIGLIGLWKLRWRVWDISIAVFLITCLIEVTQLIPFPEILTAHLLWRLLLGTTFVWWDFPHYFLGSLLGYGSLKVLRDRTLTAQ